MSRDGGAGEKKPVEWRWEQSWEEIQGLITLSAPHLLGSRSAARKRSLPSRTWVWAPPLFRSGFPHSGYVTLDMVLHLCVSHSPRLENSIHIFCLGAIMWIKPLAIYKTCSGQGWPAIATSGASSVINIIPLPLFSDLLQQGARKAAGLGLGLLG